MKQDGADRHYDNFRSMTLMHGIGSFSLDADFRLFGEMALEINNSYNQYVL